MNRFVSLAGVLGLLALSLAGIQPVVASTNCHASGNWCQGWAQVSTQTGGLAGAERCFSFRTTNTAPACPTTTSNEASWELDPGACLDLRYFDTTGGVVTPAAPNKVTLRVFFDATATVVETFQLDGAEPANGAAFNFCATANGNPGGGDRAGTYRAYVRAVKDDAIGDVGEYSVDSDGVAAVGAITSRDAGAIRGTILASNIVASSPTGGVTFAYGAAGDEQVTITGTLTQPNGDAGLETIRAGIYRADGVTVVEVSSTGDLDTTSGVAQFTIDLTFPALSESYGAGIELVGNSALTGLKWTRWATTGHGSGVERDSDTIVRKQGLFTADPRIVFHSVASGTFAGADGDVSSNHEVYNRGEAAVLSWRLLNARSEELSRSLTFTLRDSANTQCDSFTDTGAAYGETRTISTTLCLAVNTASGSPWHLRVAGTDQSQDSDDSFSISTLYYVDAHPEKDDTLTQDDFPDQDASEDHEYIIGADLFFAWCQVEGVRLDDTEIDTSGSAVAFTLFNPFGGIEATGTRDTGADGWTATSFDYVPSPPAGMWSLRCAVTFNGNTGQDDETLDFLSSFTGNLVPRFWTNTTLHAGTTYKIVVVGEVEDVPSAPDVVPRVNITRVDTLDTVPVFFFIVDDQPARNVVDWTNTVQGTTYQYNWTPPVDGVYNIRVRVTLAAAGVRAQQSVEVIGDSSFGTSGSGDLQLMGLTVQESWTLLLFLGFLVLSLWRGWWLLAGASTMGMLSALVAEVASVFPIFAAFLLLLICLWLELMLEKRRHDSEQSSTG